MEIDFYGVKLTLTDVPGGLMENPYYPYCQECSSEGQVTDAPVDGGVCQAGNCPQWFMDMSLYQMNQQEAIDICMNGRFIDETKDLENTTETKVEEIKC